METSEAIFAAAITATRTAASDIPDDLNAIKSLNDTALLSTQRELAELRRLIDSRSSAIAGEVAYRSRRELGYSGLARREGFGSADKLVQSATGSTSREATTLIAVGTMVHEALLPTIDPATREARGAYEIREPWLARVGAAVAAGELPIEKARAIKAGLGEPYPATQINASATDAAADGVANAGTDPGIDPGVTVDDLAELAERLLAESEQFDADRLFSRARQYRDELDSDGITRRERAIYDQRAFRRSKRTNGLSRFTLEPDIETAAYLDSLFDNLLSPRRGGPRFIDPEDKAWADTIANDERTNDQYLHDAIAGLIRLGVDADHADRASIESSSTKNPAARRARIVGSRVPSVRVLVTEKSLQARRGNGRIEGVDIPVSIETVERTICTSGTVPLAFNDAGQILDLGREARLFDGRQKLALATRDGGCMWPDCGSPPAWTEAHHVNQWARDGGRTDARDGILLCRFHHMLLHNNNWHIERRDDKYWLTPPPDVDPTRTPRLLTSKSAALRDLLRERAREPERQSA